jgi:transposase
MNRAVLESADRETLILLVLTQAEATTSLTLQVEILSKRVAELEAKLGLPPKTPDNSGTPPSHGRKASSEEAKPSDKRKAHRGAHRPLHPNPTSRREVMASACQHCGADVSEVPQMACEAYDHIEIPPIRPETTRVTLYAGICPCCAGKFRAPAPADMPAGSPFGPNLRALVIYLRFTQGISLERLTRLLSDILGLAVSEGAIVNMLEAARAKFAAQTDAIRRRLLSGTALESDETGLRVGKQNWWLWVFHHVNRRSNGTPFGALSASKRDPLRRRDWGGATIRDERCLSGLRCWAGAARQEAQAGQDRCFGPAGRGRRGCQLRFLNRQLSLPVSTMSQ